MKEGRAPLFYCDNILMIRESEIREMIEAEIEGTDQFLVGLSVDASNRISVELDSDGGVTIGACQDLSRALERQLDRDEEDFAITVSSPGADQPLKVRRQYPKNVGREVKVTTLEGEELKGELKEANDDGIVLFSRTKEKIEGKKGRKWVERTHELPFDKIKETKVIISFK